MTDLPFAAVSGYASTRRCIILRSADRVGEA
jgi:hypothetical protein